MIETKLDDGTILRFIDPKPGAPDNMLSEVEVVFGEGGFFAGCLLRGFTIWEGERSDYVTGPSRAFGIGTKRGYLDFIDEAKGEPSAPNVARVKNAILHAFESIDAEAEELRRLDEIAARRAGQVLEQEAEARRVETDKRHGRK